MEAQLQDWVGEEVIVSFVGMPGLYMMGRGTLRRHPNGNYGVEDESRPDDPEGMPGYFPWANHNIHFAPELIGGICTETKTVFLKWLPGGNGEWDTMLKLTNKVPEFE